MAIYGAGSNWDGDEMKDEFFNDGNSLLGGTTRVQGICMGRYLF